MSDRVKFRLIGTKNPAQQVKIKKKSEFLQELKVIGLSILFALLMYFMFFSGVR